MNALTPRSLSATLQPRDMAEAMHLSRILADSNMVPDHFKGKPGDVLVCLLWGSEVGLGPLQALQSIAVINGRPSIWGDAALALVRGHPACEYVKEGVDGEGDARHGWCEVKRRGEEPQRRTFSVEQAKLAKLWGKTGPRGPTPWVTYPDRMMQLRARGFAIRDVFPDALRGVITREEAEDIPQPEPRAVPNLAQQEQRQDPPATPLAAAVQQAQRTYPILAPSGAVHQIPPGRWLVAVTRALAGLEDAAALRQWRAAMGPHLLDMSGGDDDTAQTLALDADRMIAARLAELSPPEPEEQPEPGSTEPDDDDTFPGDRP